ncbi:MAG: hypothetical protein V4850_24290 [Myxococcota bacterium]
MTRQSRVRFSPSTYPSRVCAVSTSGEGAEILEDWLGMLTWSRLPVLADCAARQVGFGHEPAHSGYHDDRDPDDEPFEGVLVTGTFRDASVVLSRAEMDALLADLFDFVEATAPQAWPALRPRPRWSAPGRRGTHRSAGDSLMQLAARLNAAERAEKAL